MSAPVECHENDETLLALLREAGRLLTRHPRVTRAIVAGFVAEGRAAAQTKEGAELRRRLLRSELLRRARLVWESFGLHHMAERDEGFSPSWWVRVLGAAAAHPHLEALLSRLYFREVGRVG